MPALLHRLNGQCWQEACTGRPDTYVCCLHSIQAGQAYTGLHQSTAQGPLLLQNPGMVQTPTSLKIRSIAPSPAAPARTPGSIDCAISHRPRLRTAGWGGTNLHSLVSCRLKHPSTEVSAASATVPHKPHCQAVPCCFGPGLKPSIDDAQRCAFKFKGRARQAGSMHRSNTDLPSLSFTFTETEELTTGRDGHVQSDGATVGTACLEAPVPQLRRHSSQRLQSITRSKLPHVCTCKLYMFV